MLIQVPEHTLLLILSSTLFCLLWPLAIILLGRGIETVEVAVQGGREYLTSDPSGVGTG